MFLLFLLFSLLEKNRLKGDLLTVYLNYLKGSCSKEGAGFSPQVTNDRTRRNGLKMHHGWAGLDIKTFFIKTMVKHCNGLPRDVVKYSSLGGI